MADHSLAYIKFVRPFNVIRVPPIKNTGSSLSMSNAASMANVTGQGDLPRMAGHHNHSPPMCMPPVLRKALKSRWRRWATSGTPRQNRGAGKSWKSFEIHRIHRYFRDPLGICRHEEDCVWRLFETIEPEVVKDRGF